MKQLIEFKLNDTSNETVLIELEELQDDGSQRVSRDSSQETPTLESDKTFDKVLSKVKPVANAVINSLNDLNHPDEITIEFGLKFGAKAGVIFTSANSEATFKLSIKWKNDK